jgi:hypothetical protein
MKIGGVSIILILGSINMILILFQLTTGLRWIKVPFECIEERESYSSSAPPSTPSSPTLQIMDEG